MDARYDRCMLISEIAHDGQFQVTKSLRLSELLDK
jgi:hypothetical protein